MSIKERRKFLENLKEIAKLILKDNQEFECEGDKWKKKVVRKNIYNLTKIIEDLNRKLKTKNLQLFQEGADYFNQCSSISYSELKEKNEPEFNLSLRKMTKGGVPFSMEIEVAECSVINTIYLELNLLIHLNVSEVKKLAFGGGDIKLLRQKIPQAIETLNNSNYDGITTKDEKDILNSAIKLSIDGKYLCSNILLHAQIESMLLNLLLYVFKKQNPSLSARLVYEIIYKKHYSMDNTIKNIDLKKDIPISYLQASTEYKYSFDDTIIEMDRKMNLHRKAVNATDNLNFEISKMSKLENPTEEDFEKIKKIANKAKLSLDKAIINDIQDTEMISLKPKLEFLRKSIYEDRNHIFHGKLTHADHYSKNYVYFMGIKRLIELIKEMKLKYDLKANT